MFSSITCYFLTFVFFNCCFLSIFFFEFCQINSWQRLSPILWASYLFALKYSLLHRFFVCFFMVLHLLIVGIISCATRIIELFLLVTINWNILCASSRTLKIIGLLLTLFIHLTLNLCKGKANIVFVLHAEFQLLYHHLLKILSFFPVNILDIFVNYQVTIALLSYIWILNYILLTDESESLKVLSFSLFLKVCYILWFHTMTTWWDPLAEETIYSVYRI